MPLEIRVDVIPHGVEDARKNLSRITVTQVERLDDNPEGLRRYMWDDGEHAGVLQHRRSNGAEALAAQVMMAVVTASEG